MIIIRPYLESDIESLTELMADLGYPTTVQDMRTRMDIIESLPLYYTFVAVVNDEVVGMIGIREVYSYEGNGVATQISALVTKKEFQGQGIGKELVNYIERWAKENGSKSLYLTSGARPEREQAHEFYRKLGFKITGYRFVKEI